MIVDNQFDILIGKNMSLLSILGVVFVVLKLVGTIDWSWVWVLSPFITQAVLWLIIVSLAIVSSK